jgi:lysophospholipase L1-like esterase
MKAAALAVLGSVVLLSACAQQPSAATRSAPGSQPIVYAAIGASETYGIGADDRYRQAWPQLFYNDALPSSATLYNFGIPGETTAGALVDEVPAALKVHPQLVTVWLNVNDLVQGVSPSTYAAELQQLVQALRQGGRARVLVANLPDVRQLPAYRACAQSDGANAACPLPSSLMPSAAQLGALIGEYNTAIARVVTAEGATLVDLSSDSATIAQHPDWISADGFHPNQLGYLQVARTFERAYRQQR